MRDENTIRDIERAMSRIARGMGRRDLGRQIERALGTRVDASFLQVIGAVDELAGADEAPTIKDIARFLDVHHSRASRLVKDAIRSGFLMRLASQEDARKSPLALTAKGRGVADAIYATRAKHVAARLHNFSKSDRRNFARLLERFAAKDSEGQKDSVPTRKSRKRQAQRRENTG